MISNHSQKYREKKDTINVVKDCSHCDLRRTETVLTCLKQWDMKNNKVIANHFFLLKLIAYMQG